jgi:hypothetical protein
MNQVKEGNKRYDSSNTDNLKLLADLQHHGDLIEIIMDCPRCVARFKDKMGIKEVGQGAKRGN